MTYQNADGDETEFALGNNGTFLESNGAAAAPAFRALEAGDIPDLSGTYATAGHDHDDDYEPKGVDAGDVTYTPTVAADWDGDADPGDLDDALDQLAERVDDLEGGAGHNREHAMTGTDDHYAAYWKVFYSDGSGDVQELALGADGTYLKSNGAAAAPTFDTPAGGGDVATDPIWDAKGDLAGGTGANTAAKLTVGANDTMLMAASGETTGLKWANKATILSALNVEDGADVTDATNVNTAGATMNADTDVSGNGWVLDEDDMATDSDEKVPTQQSAKAYVDGFKSYHQYVFHPDNYDAPETGDGQGPLHLSGPYDETVAKISLMCKTAPDGNLTIQLEYGNTGDLDTVASWTEIDTDTNASVKQVDITTGFTNATIPAGRLIRCNWDAINDAEEAWVIMGVWRPIAR